MTNCGFSLRSVNNKSLPCVRGCLGSRRGCSIHPLLKQKHCCSGASRASRPTIVRRNELYNCRPQVPQLFTLHSSLFTLHSTNHTLRLFAEQSYSVLLRQHTSSTASGPPFARRRRLTPLSAAQTFPLSKGMPQGEGVRF